MNNRIVKTSDIRTTHPEMKRVLQGTGEIDKQSMHVLTRATPMHMPEPEDMPITTPKRKRGRPRKDQMPD